MSVEENRQVIHRWLRELWNARRLEVAREIFAPDYVRRARGDVRGPEGVERMAKRYWSAFPDLTFELEAMVAENDLVAVRYRASGTMLGPLDGLAATGRRVSVNGMDFFRFERGRIVESWPCWDELGMLSGLELLPKLLVKKVLDRVRDRLLRLIPS